MGEFSAMKAIKSVFEKTPSFCVRGLKVSEHLGNLLKKLRIDIGKEEAEMDIICIISNDSNINIIFGECKVHFELVLLKQDNSPHTKLSKCFR